MVKFRRVIEAFHDAVNGSPLGFKGMSSELGKSTSQLYDELNPAPNKSGLGKLGVEDGIEIIQLTKNIQPLNIIASELECRVRPLAGSPSLEASPLHRHIALDEAVTAFKRLDAMGERYEVLIAAMSEIANAAERVCVMARARDFGMKPEEAFWDRALFRKDGN